MAQYKDSNYSIELANKTDHRNVTVGNLYVVTMRPLRRTGIIFKADSQEECETWIENKLNR